MKKKCLISGGTGYLGVHLAKFLKPEYEVILGARNNKQNFKANELTGCKVIPMDVTSMASVRDAILIAKPDIIIHAAATKFIDLSEIYTMECWDINVVGSQNVARAAMEFGVDTVIGISTDKAVPPIKSSYGLSKAVMERMFCASNGVAKTKFACIRFGNIAWSTHSVFTIWKEKGVRLTDPNMRRFFFPVSEAVEFINLVLNRIDSFAGTVVMKKLKSARMGDVADAWIKVYPGTIERIPVREGERIDEYLLGEMELTQSVEEIHQFNECFVIKFNDYFETHPAELFSTANAERLTEEEIIQLITNEPQN